MIANLVLGSLVISLCVLIHTIGLMALTRALGRVSGHLRIGHHRSRMLIMVFIVLGVFAVLTVEVWLWAGMHYALGVVDGFEASLYFSLVTFSTVGYGDLVPSSGWRLFAALEGVSGFLLIGWSTAYLIAAGVRVGPFKIGEHF
ncbi:MAG: two pore domain potassium channel family protein [Rhizobiaceae bacterium]|nr:two pore domain potassium channel family protein [Rhizobiaceae bacterium]